MPARTPPHGVQTRLRLDPTLLLRRWGGGGAWFPWLQTLNVALLLAAAQQAAVAAPASRVVALLAMAFVPNAGLWGLKVPAGWQRGGGLLAVAIALIPGLALISCEYTPLSDDIYRFAWDARVWKAVGDPYAYAPSAPALAALRDDVYGGINYPHIATIYPPVTQVLFLLSYGLWGHLWSIKALALLAHLATVFVLGSSTVGALAGPVTWSDREHRARLAHVYACNPLALAETALSGHFDAFVGLSLLLAALALGAGRDRLLLGWLVLCTGIKLIGLLYVFWLWPRRPVQALALLVLALVMAAPLPFAGGESGSAGLSQYAQHWRGNEGGFALAQSLARPLVHALSDPASGPALGSDEVYLPVLKPALSWLSTRGLSLRYRGAERRAPRPPGVFPVDYAAGLLARALVVLSLCFFSWWRGRVSPTPLGLRAPILALLLLSPQVHPWYLLWLMPLDLALGSSVMLCWSAAVLASYAPLDGWGALRVWLSPVWVQWVQYSLVGLTLAMEYTRGRSARVDPFGVWN